MTEKPATRASQTGRSVNGPTGGSVSRPSRADTTEGRTQPRDLAWFLARTPQPDGQVPPRTPGDWNRQSIAAFIARHSPEETPMPETAPRPHPGELCGASTGAIRLGGPPHHIGPCVLRKDHDGPVHQAADGVQWAGDVGGAPTAPRPDVPDEAVKIVADLLFAVYESEYQADHLSWEDFAGQARILIEAARPGIERQVRERVAAETRRETAERVLLASDVALGYRCPACHGKPAVHRWKDTGRRKRHVCGCGHQWDASSRSAEGRAAMDASPSALLRGVAKTGDLPEVPARIARGES